MFAEQDVIVVEEMIHELQAGGDTRRAQALSALLIEVMRESAAARISPSAVKSASRPYLTTGDIARAIGVSPQTVKNWAAAGRFPITQFGGRKVVRREDLLNYLNSLERSPHHEPPWTADDVSQEELRGRLSEDLVARIDVYHERIEHGEHLSVEDNAALRALEASTVGKTWATEKPDES